MRISVLTISLIIVLFILAACEKGVSQGTSQVAPEGWPTPPPTPEAEEASSEEGDLAGQAVGTACTTAAECGIGEACWAGKCHASDCVFAGGDASCPQPINGKFSVTSPKLQNTQVACTTNTDCTVVTDDGSGWDLPTTVCNVAIGKCESPLPEVLFFPASYDRTGETVDNLKIEVPKPTVGANEEYYMYKDGYYYNPKQPINPQIPGDAVGGWEAVTFDRGTLPTAVGFFPSSINAMWYKISASAVPVATSKDIVLTQNNFDVDASVLDRYENFAVVWTCKCTRSADLTVDTCKSQSKWDCNSFFAERGVSKGRWVGASYMVREADLGQAPQGPQ